MIILISNLRNVIHFILQFSFYSHKYRIICGNFKQHKRCPQKVPCLCKCIPLKTKVKKNRVKQRRNYSVELFCICQRKCFLFIKHQISLSQIFKYLLTTEFCTIVLWLLYSLELFSDTWENQFLVRNGLNNCFCLFFLPNAPIP